MAPQCMTLPKSSDTGIMPFFDLCRRIAARFRVRTRYTRTLEGEVARLRAENHALVNSILGVAGIAPVRLIAGANGPQHLSPLASAQSASVGATVGSPGRGKPRPYECETANSEMSANNAPLRRRSWQQIERLREIEDARAARRERGTDTETFPTPRNIVPRA
jgi:hypothetical protein